LDKNDYVGLAACQIGQNKRIFVLDMQKVSFLDNSDDSKNIFVAINPEIVDGFGEEISLETCLTFPGQEFYVPRASFISFTYKDIEGNEIEMNATGFLSIQVQYMIDAIDGHHLVDTLTPSARRQAIEKLEMKKSESEDTEELYAIYGGD
jgi:peptide deformylase